MTGELSDLETNIFVGGDWKEASDGGCFDVENPVDGTVLASVASGTVEDAIGCLEAAEGAFEDWSSLAPRQRSEYLRAAFDLIKERQEFFANVITLENGKAKADAMGEVAYAAEFFRWYAEEAVRSDGYLGHAPASGSRILVHQKPAGIALLITPWNFPMAMGTRKIAPALAAGCPVVIKPASDTPLTMLALASVLEEVGIPNGVVNVLPSKASGAVTSAMLADPRVRVVSFTGSTDVGRRVLSEAAQNIVTPAMELGGNAPFIVCEDADLEAAAEGLMIAKMRNAGEACTAANRIYVHVNVAEAFTEIFTDKMAALKMGDGREADVDVGPLINAETRNKVARLVDDAIAKGATLKLGGQVPEGPGYFYPPTVLTDVTRDADLIAEEIFGPVAAIQTFIQLSDVLARANATDYGLVAYVYTANTKQGLQIAEALEFGMVGLNRGLVSDPAAPFGGVKQSGIGREGGKEGMREFQETQYIATDW